MIAECLYVYVSEGATVCMSVGISVCLSVRSLICLSCVLHGGLCCGLMGFKEFEMRVRSKV